MVIADDCQVMAGGANIASEYLGPFPDANRWRDLSFILEGPAVNQFAEVFRSDWKFAGGDVLAPLQVSAPPVGGDAVVQVVPSGPDAPGDPVYDALLSAAFTAQKRIWIVTPYFVPDDALAQALRLAARRGVDVRILVPERSNHSLADQARGTYLREVQSAGGTIYFFTAGMVHAKAVLVDDLAVLGSANLDMRSLFLNFEIAVFVYRGEVLRDLERWFLALGDQVRVGAQEIGAVGEIFEGVVRLFAPLL